jgi:hypothetical protein
MTISRIVFFNGHQHGDIANNRGVVSYIAPFIQDLQLEFISKKNAEAVFLHDNVKTYNIESYPDSALFKQHVGCIKATPHVFCIHENTLYINLWIGKSKWYLDNRKSCGEGITRESLLQHTNEIISIISSNTDRLIKYPSCVSETMSSSIKYPKHKKKIDNLIKENFSKYRKKILIPNGYVISSQCPQFNIATFLVDAGIVDRHKSVLFIITAPSDREEKQNMLFIDNIVSPPNLNEIDYLSRHCDVLITRASGPGCMISTKENYYDISKTFISFTTNPNIAFEALSDPQNIESKVWGYHEKTAKMLWSNDFSMNNICSMIEEAII